MPAPLDPDKRAAIVAAIKAGQLSRNAIAREHDVSPATVTNIAKAEGLAGVAFDRTHAEKGARARSFDAKAARAAAVVALYEDFERFRDRCWSPYTQIVSGQGGPELVTTKLPPLRDQQSGMTAAAICLDKAIALEKVDDQGGSAAGVTMINSLFQALQLPYAQAVAETAEPAPVAEPAAQAG